MLFGEEVKSAARGRGPVPQWHGQMEAIAKLPRARQRFVVDLLDAALAQQGQ